MVRPAVLFPLALLLAAGRPAAADPGVTLLWSATTGTGTPGSGTIDADTGDVLTLRVFVDPDANGVSFASLSFAYDPAVLAVDDHAECPHAASTPPGSNLIAGLCDDGAFHFLAPQAAGSIDDGLGDVGSADAATFGNAVAVAGLEIMAIDFEVVAAGDSSVDVSYTPGLDSVNDEHGAVFFPAGSATLLPEPGVAAGLLLALPFATWLARRRAGRALASSLVLCVLLGTTARAQDMDGDGVPDASDSCLLVPNAGPLACDSDGDGYGNACDADYDDDGIQADGDDAAFFTTSYGLLPSSLEPDHDCDGIVGGPDHAVHYSNRADPVGPSGLACAGSPPCP